MVWASILLAASCAVWDREAAQEIHCGEDKNMEKRILKVLAREDYAPANVPQLIQLLGLRAKSQQELQGALKALEAEGRVLRTKGNRYILAQEADLVPGVISINRQGKGFLQPDEPGLGEITVPERATGTALNGDRVLVRRDVAPRGLRPVRKGEPPVLTGAVVRILERKRSQFVGTLQRNREFLFVVPDDPRIPHNILVPPPRDVGRAAHAGDKVLVEILQWDSPQMPPEGEVIEVLGAPDEEGVDMLSVIRNYDLPLHFPRAVLQEANAITRSRSLEVAAEEDLAGRLDCRAHRVITIDPDDAKDFDDAICVERLGGGKLKLWVHIADVSHFVKPGGALDAEARERGNSTYLVDRVIPMLPEALSNELCSLKPGVDRLTKCVEFTMSEHGEVLGAKFHAAVIRSQRRFTYQEALGVLQRAPSDDPIEQMLHEAHELAQRVRRARMKAGSLDLDFPENKIRLDEKGRVKAIERMENDVSHQLIEEFMLLANEAVAARLLHLRVPAVHRIHEPPKANRLALYRDDVLAHNIPCGNLSLRPEVQKLLERFRTVPIGAALKIGFLRSMMRARYAVEPLGHYGLAKKQYTHFTSPIRRYADLMVHRVLFKDGAFTAAEMKEIADHISTTERNSSDAERDSREVKLHAFLIAQLKSGRPRTYEALVTDVRNFGFFVEVSALGLSGMVHLSAIRDDFFIFDPARSALFGKHSRQVIRLGHRVTVQVHRVDTFKKQVDFKLVEEREERGPRPRQGERHPQGRGQGPRPPHERERERRPAKGKHRAAPPRDRGQRDQPERPRRHGKPKHRGGRRD